MHSTDPVTRRSSFQSGSPAIRPRYPNIKDLQDQAALLNVNESTSVSLIPPPLKVATGPNTHLQTQLDTLLSTASEAIGQARDLADDDKSDKAYVQYLRASEITINVIPHHPNYKTAITQHPGWYKEFAGLMMVCFNISVLIRMVMCASLQIKDKTDATLGIL